MMLREKPEISESAVVTNSTFGKYTSIGSNTRFCYSTLDDFSYVSVNSNIFSTKIGKFTSVSWNVSINPAKHDINRFTQHPILFAKKYGMLSTNEGPYYKQYGIVKIGSDVWIGCNVLIMGGVNIGNGAVIGAGARISHDVPPYAIVVGNNQIIRYRFSNDIVCALEDLKWWNLPFEVIREHIGMLSESPTLNTINKLKEKINI